MAVFKQAFIHTIWRRALFVLIIFCLGIAAGVFAERRFAGIGGGGEGFRKLHPANVHFEYINPLIGVDFYEQRKGEYVALKDALNNLIHGHQAAGEIANVSVYFRDLETGQWVGINERDEFNPASLIKVPVMMAYFKLTESEPDVLSYTYTYTDADITLMKQIPGVDMVTILAKDRPYTVDTLIREMIVHSDNIAKYLLILHVPQTILDDVFSDLGIQVLGNGQYTISTKTYSLFFRTLYNATFLSRTMSEKALALLAKADYERGLVAGLPADTKISHKFGLHDSVVNGKLVSTELHDCGIIYSFVNPYLLCVMTKGYSTDQLSNIVQEVSGTIYNFLKTHRVLK